MATKRIWMITLSVLIAYIIIYSSIALVGNHQYSWRSGWCMPMLGSVMLMLTLGSLTGAISALIPFGRKKISDRFFHVTFPVAITLVILLSSFIWLSDVYVRTVEGIVSPYDAFTVSSEFPEREERISMLKSVVKLDSDISDAEFDLMNEKGFTKEVTSTVQASPYMRYEFVVKVDPSKVDAWTTGMTRITAHTSITSKTVLDFWEHKERKWTTTSEPEFYRSDFVTLVVYRKEGIIYKKIENEH